MFIDKHLFSQLFPLYILKYFEKVLLNSTEQTNVISVNKFVKQNWLTEKLSDVLFIDI